MLSLSGGNKSRPYARKEDNSAVITASCIDLSVPTYQDQWEGRRRAAGGEKKRLKMVERKYVIDNSTVLESWRLFRIIVEFVNGLETMADIQPAVSIPGSYRVVEEDPVFDGSDT